MGPNGIPFKVSRSDSLGRYIEATRDLESGDVVMLEEPLVMGPSQSCTPVCVGCYKLLVGSPVHACARCGWPMCSKLCSLVHAHRPECDFTVNNRGTKVQLNDFMEGHPIYRCITVLRCLYQQDNNPSLWGKLMHLESHCNVRKSIFKYEEDRVNIAQVIRSFFKLEEQFSEEEILKVCGIVQVNSYFIYRRSHPYVAIYNKASFIEHNCLPNMAKVFTESDQLIVQAVLPVSRGEHISISYTNMMYGTSRRRQCLAEELILCTCTRCSDPTELNTFYSAMRCQASDCEGYMTCETPLSEVVDINRNPFPAETVWRCTVCDTTAPSRDVLQLVQQVERNIDALGEDTDTTGLARECYLQNYEKLLLQYEGSTLHPNHFLLTRVRISLAQNYGKTHPGGLKAATDQELTRKIELCRQVLALAIVLFPAENRVRGILMLELYEGLMERTRRHLQMAQNNTEPLNKAILESRKFIQELATLLEFEPATSLAGQVRDKAMKYQSLLGWGPGATAKQMND